MRQVLAAAVGGGGGGGGGVRDAGATQDVVVQRLDTDGFRVRGAPTVPTAATRVTRGKQANAALVIDLYAFNAVHSLEHVRAR